MDYSKKTVKQLRQLAKELGIKPIPRLKAALVSALTAATGKNTSKQQTEGKNTSKQQTESDIIKCGGKGVTTHSLRATLLEGGHLDKYQYGGSMLSFDKLRDICMKLREATPEIKELLTTSKDVEKAMEGDEYALIIKEHDSDLFEAVKDIVPFIPDVRGLLGNNDTFGEGFRLGLEWNSWKVLYEEVNG